MPFIIALFIADSYHVERTVVLEKPLKLVYYYTKYLKKQNNFSKWANIDPKMQTSFSGTAGEVGFIQAWQSELAEVGEGEQEIIKIDPYKRIDYELRFKVPFEASEPAFIVFEDLGNTTKVKWRFTGHLDYPMNFMMLIFDFEQVIGDDLQHVLNNLKAILES